MVMVAGNNGMVEVSVHRDIDMTLVGQDSRIIVSIREAGAEVSGDLAWESMKSIEDEWVRGRGGAKFVSEGGVNHIDKECIREEGDHLIISV